MKEGPSPTSKSKTSLLPKSALAKPYRYVFYQFFASHDLRLASHDLRLASHDLRLFITFCSPAGEPISPELIDFSKIFKEAVTQSVMILF